MRELMDYCYSRRKYLITGCGANVRCIVWGKTGTNPRGEGLVEYLLSLNLNILNQGNEPTFLWSVTERSLTWHYLNIICNLVNNWYVSDGTSLSHHRYICFQTGNMVTNQTTFRDPMRNNWESYKYDLKVDLETISRSIHMIKNTDRSADQSKQAIIQSYYHSSPATTTQPPRKAEQAESQN
jgi:hypothetical protein